MKKIFGFFGFKKRKNLSLQNFWFKHLINVFLENKNNYFINSLVISRNSSLLIKRKENCFKPNHLIHKPFLNFEKSYNNNQNNNLR